MSRVSFLRHSIPFEIINKNFVFSEHKNDRPLLSEVARKKKKERERERDLNLNLNLVYSSLIMNLPLRARTETRYYEILAGFRLLSIWIGGWRLRMLLLKHKKDRGKHIKVKIEDISRFYYHCSPFGGRVKLSRKVKKKKTRVKRNKRKQTVGSTK